MLKRRLRLFAQPTSRVSLAVGAGATDRLFQRRTRWEAAEKDTAIGSRKRGVEPRLANQSAWDAREREPNSSIKQKHIKARIQAVRGRNPISHIPTAPIANGASLLREKLPLQCVAIRKERGVRFSCL